MKKKEFISNYGPLAKKLLKQGGVSWKELKERPYDYTDCGSGSVPGFIYYSDTIPFAEKHMSEITRKLHEFEADCGQLNKPTDDHNMYCNWLSWFAWENMVHTLICELEA